MIISAGQTIILSGRGTCLFLRYIKWVSGIVVGDCTVCRQSGLLVKEFNDALLQERFLRSFI